MDVLEKDPVEINDVQMLGLMLFTWHATLKILEYIWKFNEDERVPLDFFAPKSTEVLPWHLCSNPAMTIPFWGVLPCWDTKQVEEQKLVILAWRQGCFFPFLPCVLLLALPRNVISCALTNLQSSYTYGTDFLRLCDFKSQFHESCCNILNSIFCWEEPASQWHGKTTAWISQPALQVF